MIVAKASARNQKVSPKKARLVINLVRGMNATDAMNQVKFLNKKTSAIVFELLKSAVESASKKDFKPEDLIVSEAICQEGKKMKRMFIRARGRSAKYMKRMSHIKIALSAREISKDTEKEAVKNKESKKVLPKNAPVEKKESKGKK